MSDKLRFILITSAIVLFMALCLGAFYYERKEQTKGRKELHAREKALYSTWIKYNPEHGDMTIEEFLRLQKYDLLPRKEK